MMDNFNTINKIYTSQPVIEGAGVILNRVFGYNELPDFDPFLLLDDFHSSDPADYIAGFPWHPHRGIETVTYILSGEVEHGDSIGNQGSIKDGDVQWMTAGSGIIHQEMPQDINKELYGFQLWINLPKKSKMIDPVYRDIKSSQIPLVEINNNLSIKVICGEAEGKTGPVKDLTIDSRYLDISIKNQEKYQLQNKKNHNIYIYCINGTGYVDQDKSRLIKTGEIVTFKTQKDLLLTAVDKEFRLLVISGIPLNEPIAWNGPIVMNTEEELITAFQEYQNGFFIKKT